MQESLVLRTNRIAQIGAILTAQGGLPLLKIFSGTMPLNCAVADPAQILCTMVLPATPLSAANGVATMIGPWSGVVGTSGYASVFRLYDSTPTCHLQGYCSEPWRPSINYALTQQISNINGVYVCTGSGTSASVGPGPSGIGSVIVDGGVVWTFLYSITEMVLNTTNIASGLNLPVQSFSIAAANA